MATASPTSPAFTWHAEARVDRFRGNVLPDFDPLPHPEHGLILPHPDRALILASLDSSEPDWTTPYDTHVEEGNLLVYGGASALWDLLIAAGNVTSFANANAYLGVGDDNTAAAATQTDLQAASNKSRKAMTSSSYPAHTDGTGSSNDSCVFRSSWDTSSGNYTWNEWGTFNASSAGRMLNRKVASLGTKTGSDTWQLTATFDIS